MLQSFFVGFFTSIIIEIGVFEPSPNTLPASRRRCSPEDSAFPRKSNTYTSVNSSYMRARMPTSALPVIHADGVMNPITPDLFILSVAFRSAFLYELFGLSMAPLYPTFRALFVYVLLMRASSVMWRTFWLSSLADFWPLEYGGLPVTAVMSASRCRFMRLLGPAIMSSSGCSSMLS